MRQAVKAVRNRWRISINRWKAWSGPSLPHILAPIISSPLIVWSVSLIPLSFTRTRRGEDMRGNKWWIVDVRLTRIQLWGNGRLTVSFPSHLQLILFGIFMLFSDNLFYISLQFFYYYFLYPHLILVSLNNNHLHLLLLCLTTSFHLH